VIDRMEADGLVRRERPPEDRRVVKVLITAAGRKTLQDREPCTIAASRSTSSSTSTPASSQRLRRHWKRFATTFEPLRPGRVSG
jgi:DNA-binding MarR family transcriptional regulator